MVPLIPPTARKRPSLPGVMKVSPFSSGNLSLVEKVKSLK